MVKKTLLALAWLAVAGPSVGAQTATVRPARIATIQAIRRTVLDDAVRVIIELDGEVSFHEERLEGPDRVFVDLPGTRAAATVGNQTIRFDGDGDLVRQVRVGRHPNNTTRVVLDAAGVSSYSVYPLYSPYRLVIDCVRAAGAVTTTPPVVSAAAAPNPRVPSETFMPSPGFTRPATNDRTPKATTSTTPVAQDSSPAFDAGLKSRATLIGKRTVPFWRRRAPSVTPQHGVLFAEALASLTEVPAPSEPPTRPLDTSALPQVAVPPARNANGTFSIARQLGLSVSRIVIDAGHGGHDPGAHGKGVTEAELVLDVALRLEKLLQKTPGIEVVMTRRTDEFVPLQERTAMANREGADLFLSIHANASTVSSARGVETYFLNFASNLSAAAVAARENAASGQAMSALPDFVKAIALNNKLDESRDFAAEVQRAMLERLRTSNRNIKDLGVKQAPFVVLIGAAMPSVLAEISFVTNPQEARLLKGNTYRQRIAEALFNAIRKYQSSLKSVTTVAHQ